MFLILEKGTVVLIRVQGEVDRVAQKNDRGVLLGVKEKWWAHWKRALSLRL